MRACVIFFVRECIQTSKANLELRYLAEVSNSNPVKYVLHLLHAYPRGLPLGINLLVEECP